MTKCFIFLSLVCFVNAFEAFMLPLEKGVKWTLYQKGAEVNSETEEQFTILFALNSSSLSPNERNVVKRVAAKIASQGATRVLIVGHTDQLGNPEYNLRLSRRRTVTVLQRLEQAGVSSTILSADWKGEFDPKVPAGENGVEPRNRRVEIHVFW